MKGNAELGQDEGELSNLGQAGGDYESSARLVPAPKNDQKCRRRFTQHYSQDHRQNLQRPACEDTWIKQHSHRHKKEGSKRILKRLELSLGSMAMVGFAHHNAGKEGSKRKGESEQLGLSEPDTNSHP